jgi:hypothetical protein
MSTNFITATDRVFGRDIAEQMGTTNGQKVLAYLNI